MKSWHGFEVVFKDLVGFAFIELSSQITFFQASEKKSAKEFIILFYWNLHKPTELL